MAPSSEPEHVRRLIKILETRALGMVTCGAGGGGFLLMLTRLPDDADKVQNIVEGHHIDAYVATLNIDEEGLRIRVEEAVGLLGVGGA
uniref:L-fucose kinase-like protein n=2 Tax=Nannochloropsis gaditana (strain CCMP526) TaxID=1093141 RepID=I2CQ41_NANGC